MKHIIFALVLLPFAGGVQAQTLEWAAPIGRYYVDRALSVLIDDQNNKYITGHYNDTVDFDFGPGTAIRINKPNSLGGGEAYILKLDANDNFSKVLTFGSPARYDIAAGGTVKDAAGNLYVTGYFGEKSDFDPDTSQHLVSPDGDIDGFLMKLDASYNFQWVKHWAYNMNAGGSNSYETGPAMLMDAAGNFCFTGRFKGKVDLDPGAGKADFTAKGEEGYILKLDANGDFLWAKQLTKDSSFHKVSPKALSADAAGNLYISGLFQGSVDFDPDTIATHKLHNDYQMGFILKLDANGNFQWVKEIGGIDDPVASYNYANAVKADASGNVYVAGGFMGTAAFGSTTLSSEGFADIFIAKLDASGNYLWAKGAGSTWDGDIADRITIDDAGYLYITGTYRGTVDFDPGPGISYITSNGNVDVFILKMNGNGDYIWAKGMGGSDHRERIYDISVKGNHIYTVGKFTGNMNCDPEGVSYIYAENNGGTLRPDGFIIKLNQGATGLRSIDLSNATLFPNPATDRVTIDLGTKSPQKRTLSLHDVQGRKVQTIESNENIIHMPLATLPRGIYFLKIQSEGQNVVKKLVLE